MGDKSRLKRFILNYKNKLFRKQYDEPFTEDESAELYMIYMLELDEEDRKTLFHIAINELKRNDEDPLSRSDLAVLRKKNVEELMRLKIWFFKVFVKSVGLGILAFIAIAIFKILPEGIDGILNVILELKNLVLTMFSL